MHDEWMSTAVATQDTVVNERDQIDNYATTPVDTAHIQHLFNTDASNDENLFVVLKYKNNYSLQIAGYGWRWLPQRDEDQGRSSSMSMSTYALLCTSPKHREYRTIPAFVAYRGQSLVYHILPPVGGRVRNDVLSWKTTART